MMVIRFELKLKRKYERVRIPASCLLFCILPSSASSQHLLALSGLFTKAVGNIG